MRANWRIVPLPPFRCPNPGLHLFVIPGGRLLPLLMLVQKRPFSKRTVAVGALVASPFGIVVPCSWGAEMR